MSTHPSFAWKVNKLSKILSRPGYWKALQNGVAPGVEHERLLNGMTCSTVVDIGANRGQFALAARRCYPEARIISFEPLEAPAKLFDAVFSHDRKVSLHRVGIAPEHKQVEIHVSARDDSSSLLPISQLQSRLFPGTEEVGTQVVTVGPLDQWVERQELKLPALLKLDVQGFELQALRGCETFLDCFNWLYVECSFRELYVGQALADEVISQLQARGFLLRGVHNASYDSRGMAVQADFLFRQRDAGIQCEC